MDVNFIDYIIQNDPGVSIGYSFLANQRQLVCQAIPKTLDWIGREYQYAGFDIDRRRF